ncbi:MAG: alpha-glucosidase, family 31 of glycosyl hydrolase [Frondihabitans sp.]|nr:alpha-glucosidase, family 31 of glycosyl hydrolase [Frondihabitans sp.]
MSEQSWRPSRRRVAAALAVAIALVALAVLKVEPAHAADGPNGVVYSDPSTTTSAADYTRVITLRHNGAANGTLIATFEDNVTATTAVFPIYKSTNNGATWTHVTDVTDTHYGYGNRQEPSLYELPQAAGTLPEGTILLAGNVEPQDQSSTNLVLYDSTDAGSTWSYRSTIDTGGPAIYDPSPTSTTTAVWEPELILDSTGRLVVFFSDERQKAAGILQAVGERISTDGGATWGAESNVVAVPDDNTRPGMFSVTQLPNGSYFAVYEVVGQTNVPIYSRTSTDGDNWGTASNLGTKLVASTGATLFGAPHVTWAPSGGTNGTLVVNALRLEASDGEYKSDFFTNTNSGTGSWSLTPAPVDVGGAITDFAGYSASTAVSLDGTTLIQLTSIPNSAGEHDVVSNTMPLNATSYEAENAVLTDASAITRGAASGGEDVGYINYSDSSVNFSTVSVTNAGVYNVRVRYSNGTGAASSQNVSVNGGTAFSLSEPATADWGHGAWTDFTTTLNAGTNSIKLSYAGTYAELDELQVWPTSTRYEAENATLTDASAVARSRASGGEHVGYINNADSAVTFTGVSAPVSGTYTVRIGYSADWTSPGQQSVSVNGGTATVVSYPITGDWNTDGYQTISVHLNAGSSNTVKFSYDGGFAELDCIDVSQ